jgi:hypothetical protein
VAAQEAHQPDHARMAEAAQQYVGDRRGELSVGSGEDLSAMHEVKIEAAHVAEGEEMIVPLFRRGGGDGDLLGPGLSGGDQLARPAQRLQGLVPRAGAGFCMNFRGFLWRLHDRNAELVNPGRDAPRAGDPLHVGLDRKRREEQPPDGGHFGAAKDGDSAKKRAGVGGALKRGADKIGWPAHRRWQMPNYLGFQLCHRRQAGRRFGPRVRRKFCEIQARRPGLGQGRRRGARKPGKLFDAVDVAQVGGERLCDSSLRATGSIG